MRSVRRRVVLLVAPLLLATTAACSGDASGPTQEQYAEAANQVCKDAKANIDGLYMDLVIEGIETAEAGEETSVYLDRPERWVRAKVVPAYRGLSGALKGIQPPDDDYAYLADLYADLDVLIEDLHRRPSQGRALIEGDDLLRDRFKSYGITECPPTPVEPPDVPDYEDPEEVAKEMRCRQEAEDALRADAGGETTQPAETTASTEASAETTEPCE